MKLLAAVIIGSCLIWGCSSIKNQPAIASVSPEQNQYNSPPVIDKFETFDTTKLHRTKEKKIIIGGDTVVEHSPIKIYIEPNKEKNLREYVQSGPRQPIKEYDYNLSKDFYLYKQFYSNGIIKEKGVRCWYGFYIGKWYYYDNKGKLTKTDDFDTDYAFTWEDILKFCLKKNISLNKNTNGPATTIYKKTLKGKKLWIITYPDFDKDEYITLMIDAYDGNVMGKRRAPFPII